MFAKILLAFVLILCWCCPCVANADQVNWVRIVEEEVYLYATASSGKVMFELEKSYYATVLQESGDMYLVAVMQNEGDFPQITGYVWKSQVEACDIPPTSPIYPTVRLTVSADSASVKLSPVPSADTVITATNTQQVSYYGATLSYGKSWYYVYYAGKFGYVEADSVTQPNIAMHPTPLKSEIDTPVVAPPTDQVTTQPTAPVEDSITPTAEVILIVFIALVALAITLAMFLPGNGKKPVFEGDI